AIALGASRGLRADPFQRCRAGGDRRRRKVPMTRAMSVLLTHDPVRSLASTPRRVVLLNSERRDLRPREPDHIGGGSGSPERLVCHGGRGPCPSVPGSFPRGSLGIACSPP